MEWILNNLSLEKKFCNVNEFLGCMDSFLKCKFSHALLNSGVLCPRDIGGVEVVESISFTKAVMSFAPKDLKTQILSWVNKNGPFWPDDREVNENDYFQYEEIDVTDMGLGECARRTIVEKNVCSFSLGSSFNTTPLSVSHGLEEEPLGLYDIDNIWLLDELLKSADATIPPPSCWKTALEHLKQKNSRLIFSTSLYEQISELPYSSTVLDRALELCRVLECYLKSRDENGEMTDESHEIIKCHFHGDKAWFSDETDADIRKFKQELTFVDSRDDSKKVYSFHGKIKTPQVRMYFEWPIPPDQNDIQILYFGPKITKK